MRPSVACREPIARPAHRLHETLQQERLERLAQPPDVHIYCTLFHVSIAAPDPVEQLAAAEHPLRMGHEEMQQPVLGGPQGDFAVAGADPVAGVVEFQTLHLHHVGGARGRGAAQHRLDAREQLARRKWLGDVVIGAAFEAADLVLLLGSGGEHDDRDLLGVLGALQRPRELQAAHVRQHPIDQHQIRPAVDDARARLAAILRLPDFVSGAPQSEGDHVADGLFVFDHEDAFGGHVILLVP